MRSAFAAQTLAGILILVGLLTACGSDGDNRATGSPSARAATATGQALDASPTDQASTATSTSAPLPATAGEVLFEWSNGEHGGSQLWMVRTDGGEPRQLLDDPSLEQVYWPEWSPDGERFALRGMSSETYSEDIYVADADGSNLVRVTDTPDAEQDIAWSPDGTWIAFAGMDSAAFIGIVAADGSMFLRLTDAFDHTGTPGWSPDGKEIAFSGVRNGTSAIYVMEDDGANLRQITTDATPNVWQPRWSPDGSRILFSDGAGDSFYLIDAGGTNLVSLADRGVWGQSPQWSPDGQTIAFVGALPEYRSAIFLTDANGLNVRQLTPESSGYTYFDWSEDGTQIVWTAEDASPASTGLRQGQLHVINVDGSAHRVLFTGGSTMMTPRWRPTGLAIEPQPQPTWPPDLGTPVPTRTPTPPYIPTFDTSGPPWPEPDMGICQHSGPPPITPQVFIMAPDGSNATEVLGFDDLFGDEVVWSPDGRSVTYYGFIPNESIDPGITPTADAAGNVPLPRYGIRQRDIFSGEDWLLAELPRAESMAWSSDGQRLAFTYHEYEGSAEHHWIAVIDADGSDFRRIAEIPAGPYDIAISFTGEQPRVAYLFDRNLWVMNADGSDQVMLTNDPEDEYEPAWSPDGEVIFRRWGGSQPADPYDDPYQLHSIRPDGTNLRVLDQFAVGDRQPSWSPDGRLVAFERDGEIWVMNADGSNRHNMTQHLAPDMRPTWSPDGSSIMFRSLQSEIGDVRREHGQPRPIVLRHGDQQQEGMSRISCWVAGNSFTAGGAGGAVPFPAEPLALTGTSLQLDFSDLGEPGTVSISVYDLAATRANGKGYGDDAIILPCAAPGGVEESCRVFERTYKPETLVEFDLDLPPGDYVIIVHSNVVAGTEYGYVEQTFFVRDEG